MWGRRHWATLLLAVIGLSVCGLGVGGFIWAVSSNNLPWEPNKSARDYYQEVGDAFGDGFVMGFFVCFFLVLAVITVSSLLGSGSGRSTPREEPQPTAPRLRVVRRPRS
jgi:hypothetical protein